MVARFNPHLRTKVRAYKQGLQQSLLMNDHVWQNSFQVHILTDTVGTDRCLKAATQAALLTDQSHFVYFGSGTHMHILQQCAQCTLTPGWRNPRITDSLLSLPAQGKLFAQIWQHALLSQCLVTRAEGQTMTTWADVVKLVAQCQQISVPKLAFSLQYTCAS